MSNGTLAIHEPSPTGMAMGGIHSIQTTIDQLKAIRTFVKNELVPGVDFGIIPGTGQKNVLLQPGAQKVAMFYNTYPKFLPERTELGNGHMEVLLTTHLVSRSSHEIVGMGMGSCSTMESKYRYRNSSRVCPKCGKEAIIQGKQEYGGGYICFKKKGGCNAKFGENDSLITNQSTGRVDNEDIYDQRNTVLKMAMKRSLVSAAISLGCMSELFTQDLDDVYDMTAVVTTEPARDPSAPASTKEAQRFNDRVVAYCNAVNGKWIDKHQGLDGEIPSWVKDLVSPHQLINHTLKAMGVEFTDGGKFNDRLRAAARLWLDDEAGINAEWKAYVGTLFAKANAERPKPVEPEDVSQEIPPTEVLPAEAMADVTPPWEGREPGSDDGDYEEGVDC